MSDTVATQPKPLTTKRSANGGRALAEVEKWMAMIREIKNSEQLKN